MINPIKSPLEDPQPSFLQAAALRRWSPSPRSPDISDQVTQPMGKHGKKPVLDGENMGKNLF